MHKQNIIPENDCVGCFKNGQDIVYVFNIVLFPWRINIYKQTNFNKKNNKWFDLEMSKSQTTPGHCLI